MARKMNSPIPLDAPRDGRAIRLMPKSDIGSWIVTWDAAGVWRWVGLTKVFAGDARFFAWEPV